MYISNLVVKNFRALEEIRCEFSPRMNVIVGPNAIGKTTILQAIRLVKALIAPRVANEAQQALISLGAISPNLPQRIKLNALARDDQKPVEIQCTYQLTQPEFDRLLQGREAIAQMMIQSQLGQGFANPTVLIQYLSSPPGQLAQRQAVQELESALKGFRIDGRLVFGVRLVVGPNAIEAINPIAGQFVSHLDQNLPAHRTIFSYFPADRALPVGEVPVQIGSADVAQQLESYNSQPQLKYTRLKSFVFNTVLMGDESKKSIEIEFGKIFDGILKGRRIASLGVNEIGLLSINVQDIDTGRVYEMDGLSSGEKGLILMFLLIAKSIERGGIVLLDEPELHLNPTICRDILNFTVENYSVPNDVQFIVCSHSPQILEAAFNRDECVLYHIVNESMISRVGREDYSELSDALKGLGTSVTESLLYKGTILVEGDDDVKYLREGFGDILRRYNVTDRGGRSEVEKTVNEIQDLEKKGKKVDPIFIIFDRDDRPTNLVSSGAVQILQWKHRSFDNYLIDMEAITSLLKSPDIARFPVQNAGQVDRAMRDLAFNQLDRVAAREVYKGYNFANPSLRSEDIEHEKIDDIAAALMARLLGAKASLLRVDDKNWKKDFIEQCLVMKSSLEPIWESSWKAECDAKRLFVDYQRANLLRIPLATFKLRIVERMREIGSDNWRLVESLLRQLLDPSRAPSQPT